MRLGDKDAFVADQFVDAVDDGVHVLDMREAIGGGDDARIAVLALDLRARQSRPK
jgi:hypothetical protein